MTDSSFGEAGAYERIDAVAHFSVDPASERAADIVDIDEAPVNEAGEVEFSAEVVILRPTGQGSGMLFYEVPNRGRNLGFPLLNLSTGSGAFTVDDPGDGFLMEQGHTLVWGGWQAGLADDLLTMSLPVLDGRDRPLARGVHLRRRRDGEHWRAELPGRRPRPGAGDAERAGNARRAAPDAGGTIVSLCGSADNRDHPT